MFNFDTIRLGDCHLRTEIILIVFYLAICSSDYFFNSFSFKSFISLLTFCATTLA